MDKLVGALTDYVELLALGTLFALLPVIAFRIPFGKYLRDILERDPESATENPNNRIPWRLSYILLFIILFSAGVLVNAIAYWILQPAHVHIVNAVKAHATTSDTTSRLAPDWRFLALPVGRDLMLPAQEYDSYREDAKQQARWKVKSPESYGTYSGSVLERSIRLVRGVIVIILAFFSLNLLNLLPEPWWTLFGVVKKTTRRYGLAAMAMSVVLYYLLMFSYWWIEALSHREVWATSALL
jgi:hypothetical protein